MKKLFIIFAVVLFGVSCIKKDAVSFNGVDKIEVANMSFSGAVINAEIDITNNSRKKIEVNHIELILSNKGNQIATASLRERVLFEARSSQAQKVSMLVKLSPKVNALAALALQNKIDQLIVEGYIDVRMGAINRKIDVPKMSVKDFMNNFDM